jgi:predicted acylesterase/phospholipase RssA
MHHLSDHIQIIKYLGTMASAVIPRRAVALSLTGSGHLLIYQLGACRVLFQQHNNKSLDIRHVAGSSGGSVAATVVTQLQSPLPTLPALSHHRYHHYNPDQQHPVVIDEYAQAFIQKRGLAMTLLRERLTESVKIRQQHSSQQQQQQQQQDPLAPVLDICTTKCSDGTAHMFPFSAPIQDETQLELLLKCVEASCAIPRTFHPWDVFTSSPVQYPVEDGIRIRLDNTGIDDDGDDDESYVDGGIAAPAPPTPPELTRIIISPVTGESPCLRISPVADSASLRLLPLRVGDFGVQTSWQNCKALRASAGMVSTQELQEWYDQGQRDAERFVSDVLPGLESHEL